MVAKPGCHTGPVEPYSGKLPNELASTILAWLTHTLLVDAQFASMAESIADKVDTLAQVRDWHVAGADVDTMVATGLGEK